MTVSDTQTKINTVRFANTVQEAQVPYYLCDGPTSQVSGFGGKTRLFFRPV